MKKYSILIAALLVLTAVSACEKKALQTTAPTPSAATPPPAAPATGDAAKPAGATPPAAPAAPEKK